MKPKSILIFILAFSVFALLIISPLIFAFGKTGKNTQVLNKDYSLLSKTQIISKLNSDFPMPSELIIHHDSQNFSLNLNTISAKYDTKKIASYLLFRRLNNGLKNYFTAFFSPKNFDLEVTYDSNALDKILADIAAQIDRPFVPSEISLDPRTSKTSITPGVLGKKTNLEELKSQVKSSLVYYQVSTPIQVPEDSVGQLPSDSEISSATSFASKIIGKSIDLVAPDQSVVLDDKTLVSWIGFSTKCRNDQIQDYVNGLKTSLKRDPVDAVFKFENNKVTDFQPSKDGYLINDVNLISDICNNLSKLPDSSDTKISITLPLKTFSPKVSTASVNTLGIKELIGSGKSTFKHSAEIRNYNVQKGASIVNRVLVAPGDTFSFVGSLGDVTLENGYKQAYVIKKGQTVLDVGGGICQVSTTLFRAMLNAGLNITERRNHAYRVGYYEEDMPPGYDATVFIPSPDLKFKNDTGNYVLIQNTYDGKNKSLVYEIYGTSDGRKVEINNYRQWDATPAPPDVYVDDPTLPAGKVVKDESRVNGLKTAFDWKVTRNGEVIHQKTFQSTYAAWAAVYRRGPQI